MIQTTLGALVQADAALTTLATLKLSAKAAYHVTKLAKLVASETAHFHTSRDALIKELGTARPDGGYEIKPDGDIMPTFIAELTELAAVEVSIPWGPITLAMLGDEKVSAAELAALGPLLADEEPPA